MQRIGIIDDVQSDRDDIQVTILDNVGIDSGIEFKNYELMTKTKNAVFHEILDDVEHDNIQALIVDYRLDTTAEVITGDEIIEFMHDEVPEFPVVVLTNVPDEGRKSDHTDADKVYAKKVFLVPNSAATVQMVGNIMLNMRKYTSRRAALEAQLAVELQKLDRNTMDENVLEKVIQIETELERYKPIYQTTADRVYDAGDLKAVFEQLKQIEDLFKL